MMDNTELPRCRFCGSILQHTFVDLGMQPLCESYLNENQLNQMEPFYPLHVYVCERCLLVQLEEYVSPIDIFSEYAYFSSYSDTWLKHVKKYTEKIVEKFQINRKSKIVEIGSNDGYLLQYFKDKGISVLGIEPARNVAEEALRKGIPTIVEFFNSNIAQKLAIEGKKADVLIGNNVLAQVPNLNDFVQGMKILLDQQGLITMEFPHLMKLIEGNQFDTIYHEHFSYFSFITVEKIFTQHELTIFNVEELPTHGGSLRIYIRHTTNSQFPITQQVYKLREKEENAGLTDFEKYFSFEKKVRKTKHNLLDFLIKTKREGKTIVGYGAPGKGNTLLNYCGIRSDFLEFTVDRNPYKQGKFLPGTHIPIFHPDKINETKPDFIFILPWNIKDEIMKQLSYTRNWGCHFIVPIPEVSIFRACESKDDLTQ